MSASQVISFFKNSNRLKYTALALALYLFFLIYTVPATVVLSFVQLPQNITLSAVSGSAWSGKASHVIYSPAGFELGSVSWQIRPLNLLIGELAADISMVNEEQFFSTKASLGLSGSIKLEDSRFLINIASLQPLTYGMPFSYAGNISGDFPVSFIHLNHFLQLTGQLELNDLRLISPQPQVFGNIHVEFRAEKEGSSSARIKDTGGPLSIDGQLTVTKDARVNLSAKLSAREPGSTLDQIISLIGNKDETGRVQFNSRIQL